MDHEVDLAVLLRGIADASPGERLDVLPALLGWLHGAPASGSSPRVEGRMPAPLRRFHEVLAAWPAAVARNRLVPPAELVPVGSAPLVFYAAAGGVYSWATDLLGEDPRWWGRGARDTRWTAGEGSLTSLLMQLVVYEAVIGLPCTAQAAQLDGHRADAVAARLTPLFASAWRWPTYPHRFYIAGRAVATICPVGARCAVSVGGQDGEDLWDLLGDLFDEGWEIED